MDNANKGQALEARAKRKSKNDLKNKIAEERRDS
jgi:hypothetical protein